MQRHARDIGLNEPILCIANQIAPKTTRTVAVQDLDFRISWGMLVA